MFFWVDRDEREIARQLQIKLGLQDDPEEDGPSPEEAGYQRLPDSEAAADDALVECEMTSNKNSAAGLDKGGGANDETSSKTKDGKNVWETYWLKSLQESKLGVEGAY